MTPREHASRTSKSVFLFDVVANQLTVVDNKDAVSKLYYQEHRLPTQRELNECNVGSTTIDDIRAQLASIENPIPLYDIVSSNLFLVDKHDVYVRVVHQNYRPLTHELLHDLESKLINYESQVIDDAITDKLVLRTINKMRMGIEFIKSFDLDVAFDTYVRVFYKYSDLAGRQITECVNPSFVPQFTHVRPYLSRREIVAIAVNLGIIDLHSDSSNAVQDTDSYIPDLCEKISALQVTASMIMSHHTHIVTSAHFGLAQYYSLQGSFFMNQYLRNMTRSRYKNGYLESMILPMWELILTAPEFDKPYSFYRFVADDDYLRHLQPDDVFVEQGFMSTTRDPFYRSDTYEFGFVLIKVRIPADVKGIALCMETVSFFPEEQEVIFPPQSQFRLVSRDENCVYYHHDEKITTNVKTRYEFEWAGNSSKRMRVPSREPLPSHAEPRTIDFLQLSTNASNVSTPSILDRVRHFERTHLNEHHQFNVVLDGKLITLVGEWFDSTHAYKKFYGITTNAGYSIYTFYRGHVLFFIEIGVDEVVGLQMHVNFHVKYSAVDANKIIGDSNLMLLYASIAHYFEVPTIVVYAVYLSCNTEIITQYVNTQNTRGIGNVMPSDVEMRTDHRVYTDVIQREFAGLQRNDGQVKSAHVIIDKSYLRGSYCADIYEYLVSRSKRNASELTGIELQPRFSYKYLDLLRETSPARILRKHDRDETYQAYIKEYRIIPSVRDAIADFYVWLIDNRCYLLDVYVSKIDRLMGSDNPFRNDMYVFDGESYLYNRGLIDIFPATADIDTSKIKSHAENMNMYRVRESRHESETRETVDTRR